ncbi:MAG: hypothetical protein DGJ47_000810 [Rickettsiaceae bacterium]
MIEYILTPPFQTEFILDQLLLLIIGLFLAGVCYKIMFSKKLLESVILLSVFSLLIGLCYLFMDAPDVTMTEVALGSSLSTCVLLNVLNITGDECKKIEYRRLTLAIILCITFILVLSYVCFDLPEFGESNNALQTNTTQYYISNTHVQIKIPSFVAAILASYRGFDTLGETLVVLIAGLSVLLISAAKRRKNA